MGKPILRYGGNLFTKQGLPRHRPAADSPRDGGVTPPDPMWDCVGASSNQGRVPSLCRKGTRLIFLGLVCGWTLSSKGRRRPSRLTPGTHPHPPPSGGGGGGTRGKGRGVLPSVGRGFARRQRLSDLRDVGRDPGKRSLFLWTGFAKSFGGGIPLPKSTLESGVYPVKGSKTRHSPAISCGTQLCFLRGARTTRKNRREQALWEAPPPPQKGGGVTPRGRSVPTIPTLDRTHNRIRSPR